MLGSMKISRIILFLLGLGLLVAVAAPLGGVWWLRGYVNKERLTLETEKNINARVQLDEVNLAILSWPPSLRLTGIKIGPRDHYAGTPVAARPPMQHAPVKIEMAYLELVPEGLWRRHFYPRVLRRQFAAKAVSTSPRETGADATGGSAPSCPGAASNPGGLHASASGAGASFEDATDPFTNCRAAAQR